jgi:hypothetical protein
MASVEIRFGYPGLRISYTANSALTGGQLVERLNGTNLIQPAGAGSLKACGVVLDDVPAAAAWVGQPIVGDVNAASVVSGVVIPVTFAAAANPGDRLIAAASGQVTPAGATPDARTVIGYAHEAVGIGAVGLAFISPGAQG